MGWQPLLMGEGYNAYVLFKQSMTWAEGGTGGQVFSKG